MDYRYIAKKLKPRGYLLVEKRLRGPNHGYVLHDRKRIVVPPLDTLHGFYVFLHELGHIKCQHDKRALTYHTREYEAERYAIAHLRNLVAVPREILNDAKENVRSAILRDHQRGVTCDVQIARWAFS